MAFLACGAVIFSTSVVLAKSDNTSVSMALLGAISKIASKGRNCFFDLVLDENVYHWDLCYQISWKRKPWTKIKDEYSSWKCVATNLYKWVLNSSSKTSWVKLSIRLRPIYTSDYKLRCRNAARSWQDYSCPNRPALRSCQIETFLLKSHRTAIFLVRKAFSGVWMLDIWIEWAKKSHFWISIL